MSDHAQAWGAASTRYHFTEDKVSHAECVEGCRLLRATPVCITSDHEQTTVAALGSTIGAGDAWTGQYFYSSSASWSACVTGEPTNASFTLPWSPGQPHEESEHCVALWNEYNFQWRDVPCSIRLRCLCERTSISGAALATSADYEAFAIAEKGHYNQQLSIAYMWLLIIYLLIVPLLSWLPFICARRSSKIRCCRPFRSAGTTTADERWQSVAIAHLPTVTTLREAEKAAQRLWTRVSGSLLLVGSFGFWTVAVPNCFQAAAGGGGAAFGAAAAFGAIQVLVGNLFDYLIAVLPFSLALCGLAIRPIDTLSVTRVREPDPNLRPLPLLGFNLHV